MERSRKLTNADIKKYEPMVEKYIRDYVVKNFKEARLGKDNGEISLGNSGYTLNDMRQHLRTEVCVALYNYNPEFRTEEGRSVKESTFVFQHLYFRIGTKLKRMTKQRAGYGILHVNLEEVLWETDKED
jgi:hypothetical protein